MTPHAPIMTPRADATPLPYAFNPNMATPAHFIDDGQSTPGKHSSQAYILVNNVK